MSEDSCVYSSVPVEVVTIAILNYASFHSFTCVKSLLLTWKPCSWFSVSLKTFTVVNWELHQK